MYLRKIIVVTDVAVLIIETIKIVFKPIFLKQVHLLKEDVDKVCIELQKTSDTSDGKPTRGFSLKLHAQDFGTTMKE